MRNLCERSLVLALAVSAGTTIGAQQPSSAATDVYHVHFTKAIPGQAAALGDALKTPDDKAPMPGHFIVLRHQQGDDWDYCVIEHLGAKASVDPAGTPGRAAVRNMRAWHTDTFTSGPPWAEFVKAMGLGDDAAKTAGSVYSVAVWRAAPGQGDSLDKLVRPPDANAKVPVGHVVLQHLEGGPWTYLIVDRYNSWQDFATDQAASTPATASGPDRWSQIRQYTTYHHDTLADRIGPK